MYLTIIRVSDLSLSLSVVGACEGLKLALGVEVDVFAISVECDTVGRDFEHGNRLHKVPKVEHLHASAVTGRKVLAEVIEGVAQNWFFVPHVNESILLVHAVDPAYLEASPRDSQVVALVTE